LRSADSGSRVSRTSLQQEHQPELQSGGENRESNLNAGGQTMRRWLNSKCKIESFDVLVFLRFLLDVPDLGRQLLERVFEILILRLQLW
jgi:hypothetical protein